MTDDRITNDLARYEAQWEAAKKRAAIAVAQADALGGIVAGLRTLAPQVGGTEPAQQIAIPSGPIPAGSDALKRLMTMGATGYEWSAADFVARLTERGWLNTEAKHPEAAVRAAMQRLVKSGDAVRVGRGRIAPSGRVQIPLNGEAPGASTPGEVPESSGLEAR